MWKENHLTGKITIFAAESTAVNVLIKYNKYLLALLACVLLLCAEARGQSMRTGDYGRGDLNGTGMGGMNNVPINPFENPDDEEGETPADTTKKRRPRKPLESWFFDDSTRSRKNFAWNVDMFVNQVHMTQIDTTLVDFQIDLPFMRHGVGDAYQGNLGGASIPLDFSRRRNYQDFSFTAPYYSYIYTPENAPHYNVKTPYSRLSYINAGSKREAEENFSVIHAQNASPSTGFNITYHTMGTRGIYQNQRTKNTDLTAGIYHTGKRYSGHAGYIFNKLDMRDNGGLVDDYHLTDSIHERSNTMPMWLTSTAQNPGVGARNILKNNTFYTTHTYGVPLRRLTEDDFSMADVPAFYVGYAFQYDRWNRKYTDLRQFTGPIYVDPPPSPSPDEEYYYNWYMNQGETRDSISETKLSNRIFVQLQPWDRDAIVGTVDAGAGVDLHRYYMFHPDDYLTGRNGMDRMTSYYVYGSVDGRFRQYFDWDGKIHFVPLGYKQGDIEAEANARLSVFLRRQPISLSGKLQFRRTEPSYWSELYYSNHYIWSNSFDKENETRFEVKLDAPQWNAEAVFTQSIVGNKIYYTQRNSTNLKRDIFPTQSDDVVSVTGLYARKDFRLGGFHMNNRVLLQWSTNQQVAPVPLASVYVSLFYEFNIVRNVLRAKIGFDGRYNTPYYAHGFNPAVGQFFTQQEKQIGGYPMVDFFGVFKWKRMRIFFKWAHVNENLFESRDYFSVLHYPLNRRVIKFGLSWSFYD